MILLTSFDNIYTDGIIPNSNRSTFVEGMVVGNNGY